MPKKTIGIDINASHFRAVQVSRSGRRLRIEKTFATPMRRKSDSPARFMRSLIDEHGFDRGAPVAAAADHHHLYFHTAKDASPSDNHPFPLPAPKLITAPCRPGKPDIDHKNHPDLITAAEKESLDRRIELIEQARLRCEMIDAPIFALIAALAHNHPEALTPSAVIVHADDSHIIMAVRRRDRITAVRSLPTFIVPDPDDAIDNLAAATDLAREIELTWRGDTGKKCTDDVTVVLSGLILSRPPLVTALRNLLDAGIVPADLAAETDSPDGRTQLDSQMAVAHGLALRALAPRDTTGADFVKPLKTLRSHRSRAAGLRQQTLITIALTAVLAAVWIVGLLANKTRLEKQYAQLKQQTRQAFREALPNIPNIVDEAAQLEAELVELRRRAAGLDAAWSPGPEPPAVIQAIAAHTPAQLNIDIKTIHIAGSSVSITARTESFQTADRWPKLLLQSTLIKTAKVENPQKQPDGPVAFSVTIELNDSQPEP